MGILEILGLKKKKNIRIDLDPDSIREHHTIRALAEENASLKGTNAKLLSQLGELRESEDDKKEDEEVRFELNEKKKEIQKKIYPKYFSLGAFYRKLIRDKKFRDKVGFYDFQREKKLAKFGDFGLSSDGDFVLLDENNQVLLKSRSLNDIFQSVAGLGNDVSSHKIPLNVDKDGGYVENIMIWEAPELVKVGSKYKFTKAKKRKLYEYLNELREDLGEKNEYIEELETTLTNFQRENDDLKVAQRVAEDSAETSRKELSSIEKNSSAIMRQFRSLEGELSQIRNINIVLEEELEDFKKRLEDMKEKAEEEGMTLKFDEVLSKVDRIKDMFRERYLAPRTIIQEKSPEK